MAATGPRGRRTARAAIFLTLSLKKLIFKALPADRFHVSVTIVDSSMESNGLESTAGEAAVPGRVETLTLPFGDHQTWVRVLHPAEPNEERRPVVVLHGGPGMAHNYTLAVGALGHDGRRVVHYDQIGCGNSSHLPDAPPEFWTIELFVAELRNLVERLGLTDGFHLLGHSWGGMLAPEYVLRHPGGVASMTLANGLASMSLFAQGITELLGAMPRETQDLIAEHERAGTTDSAEYLSAVDQFYRRHICRLDPWPQDLQDSFANVENDPTVYGTMFGPSEFTITGTLVGWSVIDRLDGISAPTLVLSGEYDEARPQAWAPFVERISDVRHHEFAGASHIPHLETPAEFTRVVGDFLRRHD
ncbi:proline iminopeptidase-family hydrolase [Pseudonocardia yunnanensis]